MQKKFLALLLSFVFVMGFAIDADAQSRKKKTKKRPSEIEEEKSQRSGSERSKREEEEEGLFTFSKDKLAYDILGDFRISNAAGQTAIKFGLKPAVSYKLLDRLHFGVAPKIEYYFINVPNSEDYNLFDLGLELFSRVMVFDMFYIQGGYDFNNYTFGEPNLGDRTWYNSAVIGGGYMSGFGRWRYGAQALFLLNERRRDYSNFPLEFWFGFTYNL